MTPVRGPQANRADRATREDGGFSLVELIVAIGLLSLLVTMVAGLYISAMKTVSFSRSLTQNTAFAANAMNEASRVIRAGTANPVANKTLSDPAFVQATNEQMILYAYVNLASSAEQPVMISLSLNSSRQLVESRWPATALQTGWSFPDPAVTAPSSTRMLAATVAPNVAGQPYLFTYLLADGTVLPVPATGTFTADQRRTIASVMVTLTVQASLTDSTNPVTLQNTVGIPNLGLARVGQ